jgi:Lrp/AsnC family transcriptional regulator
VSVRTNQHSQQWFEKFHLKVKEIPEVVEFYRMSGDVDYLLRIVVPDIKAYDNVYKRLIKGADLFDVSSSFAMEELKFTTALPLDYVE